MNNYGYILDFATSKNTIPGCCNEILKAKGYLINQNGIHEDSPLNIDIDIQNEYPIAIGTKMYFGIDDRYLSSNGVSKHQGLMRIVQILQNLIEKDICVIGWNVSERILDTLEQNLTCFYDSFSISSIRNQLKIIDILRSSNVLVDINCLNGSQLTLENMYFFYEVEKSNNTVEECQKMVFDVRIHPSTCLNATTTMLNYCLDIQMKQSTMTSFDEFIVFLNKPKILKAMPFGKYKNVDINDIVKNDIGYINWLASQESISIKYPDLKYTITQILNKDIE